jgi:hypothetical protein
LPLINYLPDKATLFVVRKFSDYPAKTWDELLREGIRGGTESEIMNILKGTPEKPILLEPREMGMKDRIDVWKATKKGAKGVLLSAALKVFKRITGITMLPYLALAIQKELDSSGSRN